jgi:hypothetical protein
MALDLTLLSLYRQNGQEMTNLPGLLAVTPPRRAARGRQQEALIVSILLNGNTPFSTADYMRLASEAAAAFYQSPGALTTALRAAAESINRALLERNLAASGRGQYAIGWLTLSALRGAQLTLMQCGPTHAFILSAGELRRQHDPALSGKGLGLSQTIAQYFSQVELKPGDRLLLCPKLPPAWETALTSDRGLQSIEAARKRMLAFAEGDVNGVLIQVTEGSGQVTVQRVASEKTTPPSPVRPADETPRVPPVPAEPESGHPLPAHVVGRPPETFDQPSAYAIPPQTAPEDEALIEQLAAAALSQKLPPPLPPEPDMEPLPEAEAESAAPAALDAPAPRPPGPPSETGRQAARAVIRVLQAWRDLTGRVGAALRKFLPHLLPDSESEAPAAPTSSLTMAFIAIAVPVLVVTIASVFYFSTGSSAQYNTAVQQARALREQAMNESDPFLQRQAWDNVLDRVKQAEKHGGKTSETNALRVEAQERLDALLGRTRLPFSLAFNAGEGVEISRMAASDTDLYMLDATKGRILRAASTGTGYELDSLFDCALSGNTSNDALVDLAILPQANVLNSSVLGVNTTGTLLYCEPGQVPQALPLTPPDTNWGRVTAMALDGGKLYMLDAPSNAVWVYESRKDTGGEQDNVAAFPDPPTFFFGAQIPELRDAIDITADGNELYLLHADGHLTHCTYSLVESVPTRCDSPVALSNPFPAYGGADVFAQAHFTQMTLTGLPDTTLLLLNAEGQSAYRLNLRTFQLMNILSAEQGQGSLPDGPLGAVAVSPSRVLYMALGGQVYLTNGAP